MIRSFRCPETKAIHQGFGSRKFRGIEEQARKRLRWLDAAASLVDLAAIRGNRLQALKGDRRSRPTSMKKIYVLPTFTGERKRHGTP